MPPLSPPIPPTTRLRGPIAILVSPEADGSIVDCAGQLVTRIRELDGAVECLVVAATPARKSLPGPPDAAVLTLSTWGAPPGARSLQWLDAALRALRPRHLVGDATALAAAACMAGRLDRLKAAVCLISAPKRLPRAARRGLERDLPFLRVAPVDGTPTSVDRLVELLGDPARSS